MSNLRSILLEDTFDSNETDDDLSVDLLKLNSLYTDIKDNLEKIDQLHKIEHSLEYTLGKIDAGNLSVEEYKHVKDHLDYLMSEISYDDVVPSVEDFESGYISTESIKERLKKVKDFLVKQKDKIVSKIKLWVKRLDTTTKGILKTSEKMLNELDNIESKPVTIKGDGTIIFPKGGNVNDTLKSIDLTQKEIDAWFKNDQVKAVDVYQEGVMKAITDSAKSDDVDHFGVVKKLSDLTKKFQSSIDKISTLPSKVTTRQSDDNLIILERKGLLGNISLFSKKARNGLNPKGKDINEDIKSLMDGVLSFDYKVFGDEEVNTGVGMVDVEFSSKDILEEVIVGLTKLVKDISGVTFNTRTKVVFDEATYNKMLQFEQSWPKFPQLINDTLKVSSNFTVNPAMDIAQHSLNHSNEIMHICKKAVKAMKK